MSAAHLTHSTHQLKATGGRRRGPVAKAVRNVGIVLGTAARVVFLGRDGVNL